MSEPGRIDWKPKIAACIRIKPYKTPKVELYQSDPVLARRYGFDQYDEESEEWLADEIMKHNRWW